MFLFGCLLAAGAAFAPRLILIFAWIFGRRWDLVWQGNVILPILGIIFLPYTTIMYLLTWSVGGLQGFDWVWIALGVLLDIMKWGQLARSSQEGLPGSKPTAVAPDASRKAKKEASHAASQQRELDQLADLRDKGILTEEEYQAKKQQLTG